MSLLAPTPGQMLDRYTALMVKGMCFQAAKKPTKHIVAELDQLRGPLTDPMIRSDDSRKLHELHGRIWGLIEFIESDTDDDHGVADAARIVQKLNRNRHEIIKKVDIDQGCFEGDEKL